VKDIVIVGLLLVAFAWLITIHVTIVVGLAKKQPRWRALVAFVLPVLAPYWAYKEGMRTRTYLWAGGIAVYLVARLLAG
jgi:hypothetical protein